MERGECACVSGVPQSSGRTDALQGDVASGDPSRLDLELRPPALQEKLGEDKFVPAIFFFETPDRIATYSVWPDGCPIAVPDVDYFYVMRKELAPRRFFRRQEDWALLAWKDAVPVLSRHQEKRSDPLFVLGYDSPPPDVRKFVTGLPRLKGNLKGVYSSDVLDQELVDQGLATAKKKK